VSQISHFLLSPPPTSSPLKGEEIWVRDSPRRERERIRSPPHLYTPQLREREE